MLDPASATLLVRAGDEGRIGVPVVARRRPHRLGLGADDLESAIAFQLAAVAAVDEAPVVPGLGNDRAELVHAASASFAPTEATALGPASMRVPTARTSSRVTRS